MVALSHKAKQYGWFALKVFILGVAFIFIYRKMITQSNTSWDTIIDLLKLENILYIFLFLGLAVSNWFFEIKKWQVITSVVKRLTFLEATKQSLAALTISLATPNRIGDYGAKLFFFESTLRKKIAFLNFVSNGFQLLVTTIFGFIGLFFVLPKLELSFNTITLFIIALLTLLVVLFVYYFRNKVWLIRGFSFNNIWEYFKSISLKIKLKVFSFSVLRYAIFSSLFFLIFQFFGANSTFWETLPYIFSMYLLVSIIPMFMIFDVIVKGSIAVWLFNILEVSEVIIITTVLIMWILNFIIPAIFGSFYVLKLKIS